MTTPDHNSKELDKFKDRLNRAGLKATAQRVAIHEAMMALGHASADMVSEWLRRNSGTKVTVASVYNTLSQMALLQIYNYRMSADNKMYFDVTAKPHLHMYDCVNNTFRDINDEKMYAELLDTIGTKRFRGYKLESVDIQFVVRPKNK